jgi:hypothetical protein
MEAAVSDGLDIVGQYAGRVRVVGHSRVKLPTDAYGFVNPNIVGYKPFDKATDLHVFVARISLGQNVAGLGYRNSGVAWADSRTNTSKIPLVIAHEVSHALGFVLPGAPQAIRGDMGHCATKSCIMTPKIETNAYGFGDKVPTDFCLPCKADMRDVTEENVSEIHQLRRELGHVTAYSYAPVEGQYK